MILILIYDDAPVKQLVSHPVLWRAYPVPTQGAYTLLPPSAGGVYQPQYLHQQEESLPATYIGHGLPTPLPPSAGGVPTSYLH